MQIGFPFNIDHRGRTTDADKPQHLRQMSEQILFTSPGERVNQPEFGCDIMKLVFAPNSPELAQTVEFLVHSALQRWMAGLIQVQSVDVQAEDSTLRVAVQYLILQNQQQQTDNFELKQ